MYNTFMVGAVLTASVLASNNGGGMTPAAPATCDGKIQASGMSSGMGDQMVTIVQVADKDGALKYFPDNVQAPVGSIVQFQFNPKNHTVTESSFAEPCKPLAANLTSAARPGLRSGFVPVTPQDTDIKVFNVLVNDTKPIWIYCGQGTHCQQGMSMVINQNMMDPEKTIQKYQEKAAQVPPPAGMTVPPPSTTTPAPGAGPVDPAAGAIDPAAASMSMSMSMSMSASMTMTTSIAGDASQSTPLPDVSNGTATQQPGSGPVTSGQASGTPAGLTSFANPQAIPFRHAGLAGLLIAVGAMML